LAGKEEPSAGETGGSCIHSLSEKKWEDVGELWEGREKESLTGKRKRGSILPWNDNFYEITCRIAQKKKKGSSSSQKGLRLLHSPFQEGKNKIGQGEEKHSVKNGIGIGKDKGNASLLGGGGGRKPRSHRGAKAKPFILCSEARGSGTGEEKKKVPEEGRNVLLNTSALDLAKWLHSKGEFLILREARGEAALGRRKAAKGSIS